MRGTVEWMIVVSPLVGLVLLLVARILVDPPL